MLMLLRNRLAACWTASGCYAAWLVHVYFG